ncbi:MAG: GTP-binding protein, partial [Limisphaerales bacterium]
GPRYIVIGGFLGAGKTTAIASLGHRLQNKNHKVGVITNDEGTELVDTAQLRAAGFLVEEVVSGAFGTQPDALISAAERLAAAHCDIIFAECSGTSGNLRSTLLQPLEHKHGRTISIAPLSVMLDSVRAARFLRLEPGATFSEQLNYIYRKQIEEAALLVINKCELLPQSQLDKLNQSLGEIAPHASILTVSARHGTGLDEWLHCLMTTEHTARDSAPFDPEVYHQAEALLGWLNCTISVSSVRYFDGGKLLTDLATTIQSLLKQDALEVAHLKLLLRARNGSTGTTETASIHLVRNDLAPEVTGEIREPVQRAELILNLRAEAKPEVLHTAVNRAILENMDRSPELFARMEHCEHFRPHRAVRTSASGNRS